jgi:hypothetical protein
MPEIERPEPVGVSFRDLVEQVDLNLASLSLVPDTGSTLDLEYEIMLEDFLSFAQKDILQDDIRGLVNGLANAKRAIDCQVEKLLACLGLPSARSFPKKMDLLTEIGVVAPRIVTKVVRARNYLEHEYRKPEKEQSALVRNTRLHIRRRHGKEAAHTSFSWKLDFEGIRPRLSGAGPALFLL